MKKLILILTVFVSLFSGCDSDNIDPRSEGKVEFYLLKSFETEKQSFVIDEESITLENDPIIVYEDLTSYDQTEHSFTVKESAIALLNELEPSIEKNAFALVADGEIIYTGYFWPSYSSTSCDWIVIDPVLAEISGVLSVKLGYPGLTPDQSIEDRRNDPRLIKVLEGDNKLK